MSTETERQAKRDWRAKEYASNPLFRERAKRDGQARRLASKMLKDRHPEEYAELLALAKQLVMEEPRE